MPSTIRAALALAVLFTPLAPLAAQDQDFFGAAVAFAGPDLMVVKRAPARGPAAVMVYGRTADGWTRKQVLHAPGAVERGLALSASLTVAGNLVLVGGGDPYGHWGAHAWEPGAAGWVDHPGITISPEPEGTPEVSLSTVMQILRPLPRAVSGRGEFVVIGYGNEARLFHNGGDVWHAIPIEMPKGPGVGSAVAMADSTILVGAPLDHGGVGRVLVIGRGADQGAVVVDSLAPDGLPARAGFGNTLAYDADHLAVGAPGAGMVVMFTFEGGRWVEQQRISGAGAGFGTTVALQRDKMVVAAPQEGTVTRYHLVNGAWQAAGQLTPPVGADRTSFGSALAIGEDALAVGAPTAVGGRGRVWVFPRSGDGFGVPVELAPDPGPATVTAGAVRCQDGEAAGFDCSNVDLESFLSIESLGGDATERVSDIWGWTDPRTRREYALVGRTSGLVFVDITDAASPRVVGTMAANPSGARDIKTYRNHVFLTGDGAGDHGLMIFDLTRLRDASGPPQQFVPDAVYHGIASAHNLAMDTVAALAIPVSVSSGGTTCGGGLHFVDVHDPVNPKFAGCFTDTEGLISPGRTHDVQCTHYSGPDARFQAHTICFASNETALRVVDATDPANPVALGRGTYPGAAYIHQGWLTDDQRYFYLDDELDELVGTTQRTRTMIWDVSDLDDPVMIGTYLGPDGATDHNLYVKGNRMYQANYQAGLRVIDVSDPRAPREVGHFDTTPYGQNAAGFYGAWSAWPFYPSGNVIVSSMQEGLFVLRPRPAAVP